ncbi:hypothetical protein QQS21_009524 [Conoideocrella luteorostrata]|uniref:Uncharacterized protein n=1 Tax=Conoideocrella luteorostrata TaxID=1105319 RepID=A0AAJ0FQ88_9HYPO|nr:hypothetical protein QQS21_009524 [Conoideocrella luteorostrata]
MAEPRQSPTGRRPAGLARVFILLFIFAQLVLVGCVAKPTTAISTTRVDSKAACPPPRPAPTGSRNRASTSGLNNRAEKYRTWKECIKKGDELKRAFRKTSFRDKLRLASPWVKSTSLPKWGWKGWFNRKNIKPYYKNNLDAAFKDKDAMISKNTEMLYTDKHINCYKIDGTPRYATKAVYSNVMNPKSGAIIADFNFSPSSQSPNLKPKELPSLKNWSDIVYFQWANACRLTGVKKSSLKYIFRAHIVNQNTYDVVADAVELRGRKKIPSWKNRITIPMSTPEGKAILGTPHGAGAAYLLIQHKMQLGNKEITHVTVWDSFGPTSLDAKAKNAYLNLRFTVRNVGKNPVPCCDRPFSEITKCPIVQYDKCYFRLIAASMKVK